MLFIHITKTGGHSIRTHFEENSIHWRGGHITAQHVWDTKTDGKLMCTEENGMGYGGTYATPYGTPLYFDPIEETSMAVVRNPYDKIISTYHYLQERKRVGAEDKSFDEWFDFNIGDKGRFTSDILKLNESSTTSDIQKFKKTGDVNIAWTFWLPQYYWLSYNGEIVIDKILKFENLEVEYNEFIKKNDFDSIPLEHLNSTKHDHYSTYFNNNQIEIVQKLYKKDLDTFNYKF